MAYFEPIETNHMSLLIDGKIIKLTAFQQHMLLDSLKDTAERLAQRGSLKIAVPYAAFYAAIMEQFDDVIPTNAGYKKKR